MDVNADLFLDLENYFRLASVVPIILRSPTKETKIGEFSIPKVPYSRSTKGAFISYSISLANKSRFWIGYDRSN
jgi:hypothetical protein